MAARKRSRKWPMRSSPGRSRAGKEDDPPRRGGESSRGGRGGVPARTPSALPASRGHGTTGRLTPVAMLGTLERREFPASVYLEGRSEPVKAALLAELRAAWAVACPESPLAPVFRAAEAGIEQLLAAWQGASLFSPRDLVIVLEIEDWSRSEKKVGALADAL